jgi:lipopolysaccharide biosynthesis glycosyltransferase
MPGQPWDCFATDMERKPSPIEVAFCTDAGYVPQLAAALVSLFKSNWQNSLSISLVTTDLSESNRHALEKLALTYGRSLQFYDLNVESLRGLAEYAQPKSTYYRLLLPDLLQHIPKLIYLDCDLVVEIDLEPLWQTELNGALVVGVAERDSLQPGLQAHVLTPGDPYINAGVLVMNLQAWRNEGVARRCLEWLQANPTIATMMDQDAINHVCRGRKAYVPDRWNLNPIHGPAREVLPNYPERVLHFAGPIKPWHAWYCQDLADIFYGYLKEAGAAFKVEVKACELAGQYVSAANQAFERETYPRAAKHYQEAVKLLSGSQPLNQYPLIQCINTGNRYLAVKDMHGACDHFRAALGHWGMPLSHTDIYKIPMLRPERRQA